ncbi:MAG TPA: penicillin-binding protein 2, partial [Halieaceae bacterium]|nr:penicillin-binding protein 2 [Halieaceae bacterium]
MAADRTVLKDPSREARIFVDRLVVCAVLIVLAFGLIAAQYYKLQIVDYDRYAAQSDQNRLQTQPIAPRRGLIRERGGRLIAGNEPTFLLSVVAERTGGLDQVLSELQSIIELSDDDIQAFQQRR